MANLPVLSGKEVVKSFEKLGWRIARQSSSHIIMTKEGEVDTLSIPVIKRSRKERFEA